MMVSSSKTVLNWIQEVTVLNLFSWLRDMNNWWIIPQARTTRVPCIRWINLSFCCLQPLSVNIPASVNIGWHYFGSVFVRVLSCRKSHYLVFLPWECSLQTPVPKEERARNSHPSMLMQEENTLPYVYIKVLKGLAQPTTGVGQFSSNIHAQNSCLQHAPERGSWVN